MPVRHFISRRAVFVGLAALSALPALAAAQSHPRMIVTKDPTCGCCGAWVEHVRSAGFQVEVVETADLAAVKARLGVPDALRACHTAEIGRYVIEGHVPAQAVQRLLTEMPDAKGLAVPGMPVGSPGMEVPGAEPESYDVVLFGGSEQRVFARFRGQREV